MKSKDQYLFFDSQLQPKDKLGLAKDEILMKEFEPEGSLCLQRKDNVFDGSGQDQL